MVKTTKYTNVCNAPQHHVSKQKQTEMQNNDCRYAASSSMSLCTSKNLAKQASAFEKIITTGGSCHFC